ncbi:MAG: hypothetical protein V6Z86_05540 [Hyphomicrobiales bacterium]
MWIIIQLILTVVGFILWPTTIMFYFKWFIAGPFDVDPLTLRQALGVYMMTMIPVGLTTMNVMLLGNYRDLEPYERAGIGVVSSIVTPCFMMLTGFVVSFLID